jgi:hypothetical protein
MGGSGGGQRRPGGIGRRGGLLGRHSNRVTEVGPGSECRRQRVCGTYVVPLCAFR